MRPLLAVLLALPAAASSAAADDAPMVLASEAGRDYAIDYVGGGFTFQAMDLTVEAIGGEAVRGVELIRLLPSCEAKREFLPQPRGGSGVESAGLLLALGTWDWTAGGLEADFPGLGLRFPRREVWPSGNVPCRR